MRKIGIATLTLLAIVTAACGESPVGTSAAAADAALNGGGWAGSGHVEEEGRGTYGPGYQVAGSENHTGQAVTAESSSGIGFLGSGH